MKTNPMCRVCGIELINENWYPSYQKTNQFICKECSAEKCRLYRENNIDKERERSRLYREANPDKAKECWTRHMRKNGVLPMSENKECPAYYGIYINEGLLKLYFNDVEVMPMNHSGYDFVCNNGWKIDSKSSFTGDKGYWRFAINHNTTADYFFCVAYDNRQDLNILHIWILPGHKFNHLTGVRISKSTIHKWDEYEQPIDKAISCCDSMKV